jgi:hypothetical protein
MLGFVIGTLCLIGLIKVVRRGRHGRWGHGPFGRGHACGGGWGGGYGRGPRAWLNRIFARLDTSPSQEKVIVGAVDELVSAMGELRGEGKSSRSDIARLIADESFDAEKMGELFARHDDAIRKAREAFAGAFGKVHATLDPRQRAELARLLEAGPWGFRGRGGPYRDPVNV